MYELIRTYQLDIMLALSTTCMLMAILLLFTKYMQRRRKWILFLMEIIAAFLLFFDRLAYIYAGAAGKKAYVMVRLSNFMVFFLTAWVVFGFNLYITDLVQKEGTTELTIKRLMTVGIASIVEMVMVVVSQFTGWYYYIDEANHYHRGPLFLLCYIVPVIGPLVQFSVIQQYKKQFSKRIYISFVLYIFVPIIAAIVQIFAYGLSLVNIAMVMVSISLYFFTYIDINEMAVKAHRKEMEILQEEKQSMKRLLEQVLMAMVAAIEKKDPFLQGHSKRVAGLSKKIAQMSGKNEEICDDVYYAALLHEIGVFGVPDSVLMKNDDLSEEEEKFIKKKPIIAEEILSPIRDFPNIKAAARYGSENYDGTGYPDGLEGEEIPEIARIVKVAGAYDSMTGRKKGGEMLPQQLIREEFVQESGSRFDPAFSDIMVRIIDEEERDHAEKYEENMETELNCREYRDSISRGIRVMENITRINFQCFPDKEKHEDFSAPSIVLFDSFDRCAHKNARAISAYKYLEYGEIWFDGHYVCTSARNMEASEGTDSVKGTEREDMYEITASRLGDHLKITMKSFRRIVDVIVALPDRSKWVYIGITGENCKIRNISIRSFDEKLKKNDVRRIASDVSYIDRLESDVKNIQVDSFRSAHTKGILVNNGLQLAFHVESLPSASFIWNCPYVVLFYSEDKKVGGIGYHEYALIKLNGENENKDEHAENRFSMKKLPSFNGWEEWKKANSAGAEYKVDFEVKSDKVILHAENMGILVNNTTIIRDGHREIYAALTGDQIALTDIRCEKRRW